jgi:hypothetical protein
MFAVINVCFTVLHTPIIVKVRCVMKRVKGQEKKIILLVCYIWGVQICVGSEVTLEFPGWHEASYILTAHKY